MPTDPTILPTFASPGQTHADAELALRRIANVFADRESTPDDIMKALRSWSHLILATRTQTVLQGEPPPRIAGGRRIVDIVELSSSARNG